MKLGPIQTKWVESLEKYPQRQMKFRLGYSSSDGSYKACCLGEGGLVAGVCNWSNGRLLTKNTASFTGLDGVYEHLGLRDSGGTIQGTSNSLANMNDSDKTWPEIAAFIRENPTLVFTKSV